MAISIIKFADLANWSIGNVVGEELSYNPHYDLVKLSDLLTFEEEKCVKDDDTYYQQVTLKSNGNGLEKRRDGYKKGVEIRTKDQHYLRTNQLVFSKIDARNGAFALVSEDVDGSIVTKDFPTYRVNEQRVRPQYLLQLLLSAPFQKIVGHCSKGTTKRQRVDIGMLMSQLVPVPTLDEQDRILDQYQELLGDLKERPEKIAQKEKEKEQCFVENLGLTINEAQKTNEPAKLLFVKYDELPNWNVSTVVKSNQSGSDKYPLYSLAEIHDDVLLIKKGFKPKYKENSPIRILNQKCVRWNFIDLQYAKGVESNWASGINEEYVTRKGDILINSTGEGTIGRSAVVDQPCIGMLYDSHVLLLRVNPQRLYPLYLSLLINSTYGQTQIENLKSSKTTNQTELGIYNLSKMTIPIPPLSEQETLVAKVQEINDEIALLQDVEAVRLKASNYFKKQVYQG